MSSLEPGEKLILAKLEDWFLKNLEAEALERLQRRVGKLVTFVGDVKHGLVEVEFTATEKGEKITVNVMVEPSSLERRKK